MKITNIESFHLRVPYNEPEMRGGFCDLLYLRVDADIGLSGWGQAWSMKLAEATKMVIDHAVAPFCLGQDVLETSGWMERLLKSHGNTRSGPFTFAASALDIALWDLRGKEAGLPLHALMGGTQKTSLGAYASLIFYGDAERTAEKSKEATDCGYKDIKLHEEAVEPVRAAREAVGDAVSIRLDPAATYPWNTAEAMEVVSQLEAFDLFWLEEPIWPVEDYWSLGKLAKKTAIPLAGGENCISALDFRHLREIGGATYLQPSVTKIGGISETLKVIDYAKAVGAIYAPHSFYYGPGYLASLHMAAACPEDPLMEQPYFALEAYPYGENALVSNGLVEVPSGPGLGYDPDPEFLKEYGADPGNAGVEG